MSKIDWDKPVRAKFHESHPVTILHVGELHVFGYANDTATIWLPDGSDLINDDSYDLENVPQEPEREEGWYCVDNTIGYWSGEEWFVNGSRVVAPSVIGSRQYRDHEFRPADECPPPLTGELFEVYHGHAKPIEVRFSKVTDCWHEPGCEDPTYSFDWILKQAWRPLQGSQP